MRTFWYRNHNQPWQFNYDPGTWFPNNYQYVADFAVWSKPLSKKELAALKQGKRPNVVSPKKLKQWSPMICPTEAILGTKS